MNILVVLCVKYSQNITPTNDGKFCINPDQSVCSMVTLVIHVRVNLFTQIRFENSNLSVVEFNCAEI